MAASLKTARICLLSILVVGFAGNQSLFANAEELTCPETLEGDPNDATIWSAKGYELFELGSFEEALKCYDKALELSPNSPDFDSEFWLIRGNLQSFLGHYAEAVESYDNGLAVNSEIAKIWFKKGIALSHLGRYEEALASYEGAIQVNPTLVDAWYGKGSALDDLGRTEEATVAYETAIKLDPYGNYGWVTTSPSYLLAVVKYHSTNPLTIIGIAVAAIVGFTIARKVKRKN